MDKSWINSNVSSNLLRLIAFRKRILRQSSSPSQNIISFGTGIYPLKYNIPINTRKSSVASSKRHFFQKTSNKFSVVGVEHDPCFQSSFFFLSLYNILSFAFGNQAFLSFCVIQPVIEADDHSVHQDRCILFYLGHLHFLQQ